MVQGLGSAVFSDRDEGPGMTPGNFAEDSEQRGKANTSGSDDHKDD